jgi:poly(hydroxyalkanoate) depolymerase family esterase
MKLGASLCVTAAILATAAAASAGTVTTETIAGYSVRVFAPAKPDAKALVVMLHGCTQTADAFADATRMDDVAEESGFVVAYPSQLDSALNRCWQWFDPAHQARDAGEPKAIAELARAVALAHRVDEDRVYVAGLSAGAAMSVVLGATYPDRFAAIGVVAGVEYKAASSLGGTLAVAGNGGPDPDVQGRLARDAMGGFARAMPVMVFHGSADGVLSSVNGRQVAAQWRKTNALVLGEGALDAPVTEKDGDVNGYAVTRVVSRSGGSALVTLVEIDGLGHAWPGGKSGGSYADPKGPDASRMLWSFFAKRTRSQPLAHDDASPSPASSAPPQASNDGSSASSSDRSGGCAIAPAGSSRHALLAIACAIAAITCRRRRTGTSR